MYGFKECSSCGALYNREHCCSNVSSVDNFVRDPNPISYDETSDSSQQPTRNCSKCGGPFGGLYCRQCTCERCRRNYTDEVCALCCYEVEKSFVNDSNPNSFSDSPDFPDSPPQPQYDSYSCELCGNDAHFGYDCPTQVPFIYNPEPCYNQDLIMISRKHAFREKQHQPEDIQELLHKLLKDLQIISEELAEYINSPSWNCPAFYDDDDEYTIQYKEYLENSSKAITPDLPTEEPDNSLSMGDEHLSTIPEMESDEVIKSSVEDLILILSESEGISDDTYDMPFCDNSLPLDVLNDHFEIFFDFNDDYISTVSYPKIDSLLEEFSGELAHINLVPPGINKADFDPEEEIRLIEELLYDNSSPRPPKESNSEISDATIESSSPSPIPVEDSDSLMEEIDLFLDPDDSIPPGIESDDYDSEGDILFLEELLSNDSLSLPETESFHFDHYDVPSSPRPPAKPPDDGIFFDFEPDTGVLTAKVVEDISEHYVLMPKLLPTQPTLCPDIDTLLPFSSENEDKVFNPGILSSPLLSHRGKFTFDFLESPMMISGGNIPLLDVPYGDRVRLVTRLTKTSASIAPDYEDSRARGFVHRPLDLQSFACLYMGI
ncbi:hypothetical protein Tco_0009025 [Tanacetum coccineum]